MTMASRMYEFLKGFHGEILRYLSFEILLTFLVLFAESAILQIEISQDLAMETL